jgi:hypothetical protein
LIADFRTTSRKHQPLATFSKKLLQDFRGPAGQHAAANLHLVIQAWVIDHPKHGVHGASFRVIGAIDQAANARVNHRPRAHGARLNCSKEFAVDQPVVAEVSTGISQGQNLSMCSWVIVGEVAIPTPAYDSTFANQDGAHRHLSDLQSALRAAEGFFHPELIGGGQWRVVRGWLPGKTWCLDRSSSSKPDEIVPR